MEKLVLIFFVSFVALVSQAVTVKITVKKGQELLNSKIESVMPSTVGDISVQVFDAAQIKYEGGSYGFSKIYDLGQDIDVISDTEMKAYGWCFAINGEVPETMPDKTEVLHQESVIEWYYAYAHYKGGEWIGQCVRD